MRTWIPFISFFLHCARERSRWVDSRCSGFVAAYLFALARIAGINVFYGTYDINSRSHQIMKIKLSAVIVWVIGKFLGAKKPLCAHGLTGCNALHERILPCNKREESFEMSCSCVSNIVARPAAFHFVWFKRFTGFRSTLYLIFMWKLSFSSTPKKVTRNSLSHKYLPKIVRSLLSRLCAWHTAHWGHTHIHILTTLMHAESPTENKE